MLSRRYDLCINGPNIKLLGAPGIRIEYLAKKTDKVTHALQVVCYIAENTRIFVSQCIHIHFLQDILKLIRLMKFCIEIANLDQKFQFTVRASFHCCIFPT